MPVDEKDFLAFAESLPNDSEINIRNAISRFYYASFHCCVKKYHSKNASKVGGMHIKLSSSLINSSNKNDKRIGYMLQQLHQLRVAADYLILDSIVESDRITSIKQTKALIELVEAPA